MPSGFATHPLISGVGARFSLGALLVPLRVRGTDVEYPDLRVIGQEVTGFSSPERILNISEMPDDTDFPYPSPRGNRCRWSVEGLVDDASFGSKMRRQFFDGFRLKRDEPVGKLEGFPGRGIGVDVTVDICTG